MDEIVLKSIAKWPNVPAVYGWLELDRRGQWRIKGERIANTGLTTFIARNYECDATGRWYFQNGPQRVYVRIDYLPYVVRVDRHQAQLRFCTHTQLEICDIQGVWMDEVGSLILGFSNSAGSIHDQDLEQLLPFLCGLRDDIADDDEIAESIRRVKQDQSPTLWLRYNADKLPVQAIQSADLARIFRFIADPSPAPGEPEC